MMMNPPEAHHVLVIDDNLSIHEDFKRILAPVSATDDLDAEAAALLGTPLIPAAPSPTPAQFQLSFASQGQTGCEFVAAARAAGRPFALAFVDMRMPPGWDGLTTISKLWEIDPRVHIVICTAHSDRSWDDIAATLTARDRWAILKKPFDKIEVLQLTHVLTAKWSLARSIYPSAGK